MEGQSEAGKPTPVHVPTPPAIEAAPSIHDLRTAAAHGSVEAHSALRALLIEAANEGRMPIDAALSAAELYASLAAAIGGRVEKWDYVSLLAARASRHLAAGAHGSADWYQREAGRLLHKLDADGDEAAAVALADLDLAVSEVDPAFERTIASVEDTLQLAAQGDASCLASLVDACLLDMQRSPGHALAMAEEAAWLAACAGSAMGWPKLAAVLVMRGFHEWEGKRADLAVFCMNDAVGFILAMIDRDGNPAMIDQLTILLASLPGDLLAAATTANPAALLYAAPAGIA